MSSRPVRALWIEMVVSIGEIGVAASRPVRALWIEIEDIVIKIDGIESRPVRALWIEMWRILKLGIRVFGRGP